MRRLVCTIGLVLAGANVGAQGVRHEVLTRVYNTFGVPREELRQAQRLAGRIFADAGVGITWRECRTPGGPSAASTDTCHEVLQQMEVITRVIAGPPADGEPVATFGFSLVDKRTRSGVISTVFADRITETADRVAVSRGDLLGVTLAHELGHLLLGTPSHTASGIMRAHWPDAMLRFDAAHGWRFSTREASQMNSALLARAAPTRDAERALATRSLLPPAPAR